jgi:site-specific DNA-methyltransferase (adenine-specific)
MTYKILKGNSLDLLPTLADNSIDAIVTDPPYGLGNPDPDYIIKAIQQWASGDRSHIPEGKGFMGKSWDSFVPPPAIWDECLRVLKPGGHLLAFAGTRTYDLMGISIRMAGFEIRDSIGWVYGSGFPKSMDVSKAIDKAAGAERQTRISQPTQERTEKGELLKNQRCIECGKATFSSNPCVCPRPDKEAITPEAQQWQGWGTALKPALEPIVVARKPLIGTVAANVLTHGTGGLNIDASRITHNEQIKILKPQAEVGKFYAQAGRRKEVEELKANGRWPANLILDEYTAELLDEQSGLSKSPKTYVRGVGTLEGERVAYANIGEVAGTESQNYGDSGGASRFFYVAKASKRDRNEGLEELEESLAGSYSGNVANNGNKIGAEPDKPNQPAKNFHPTVKPTALMQYLVKLVTPPGGTVLDPFTGSGSTGKAAILEGFDFIGIELTEDYWPIIEGRLKHAEAKVAEAKENQEAQPEGLF